MTDVRHRLIFLTLALLSWNIWAQPTKHQITRSLHKAALHLLHREAISGGYTATKDHTNTISTAITAQLGQALLDAHQASPSDVFLNAAKAAGQALLLGQLESGGWQDEFSLIKKERKKKHYRLTLTKHPRRFQDLALLRSPTEGWHDWRLGKFSFNKTVLTGITNLAPTQQALLFLIRLDRELRFEDQLLHLHVGQGLKSLLNAQYPNGAWSPHYDRFPSIRPELNEYLDLKAKISTDSKKEPSQGIESCYSLQKGTHSQLIDVMIAAYDAYGIDAYRDSYLLAGHFLTQSHLRSPKAGWSTGYNELMHPDPQPDESYIDDKASIDSANSLLKLHSVTKDKQWLAPIPSTMARLKKSTDAETRDAAESLETAFMAAMASKPSPMNEVPQATIASLIAGQDSSTGAWPSDYLETAKIIRSLAAYLKTQP